MNVLHKLLGTKRTAKNGIGQTAHGEAKPDQLSVDLVISSQQNNQAALRVRHTLAQLLERNDAVSKPRQ